jgi:hypothetical protein
MDASLALAIRQVGLELTKLTGRVSTLERSSRTTQLEGATVASSIAFTDTDGNTAHIIGLQPDGSVAAVSQSVNAPNIPSTPTVVTLPAGLAIQWDGTGENEEAWTADFVGVQVHISTTNGFTPDSSTLQGVLTGPGTWPINSVSPDSEYYCVLVGYNTSGLTSGPSAQVSIPTVDFVVNALGAFWYIGPGAFGNLFMSSCPVTTTTDSFGNSVVGGCFCVYSATAGITTQITPTGIIFQDVPAGITTVFQMSLGQLNMFGIGMGQSTLTLNVPLILEEPVTSTGGVPGDPTVITTDSWNAMTLTGGWTIQTSAYARYQLMPDNSVWVQAKLVAGTLTNGTTIWHAPSGYIPTNAHGQTGAVVCESGTGTASVLSPYVSINNNGNLIVEGLPSGLVNCSINFRYSLS